MTHHELEKQIRAARPTLRSVAPLAHFIVCVYIALNFALGLALMFGIDTNRLSAPLLIVNETFTYEMWGAVFFSIGILKAYSLITNNWLLTRRSLVVGVAVKAAWAVALIIRTVVSPGTVLIALLWIALAAIQIITFIFFFPPNTNRYRQTRLERVNA